MILNFILHVNVRLNLISHCVVTAEEVVIHEYLSGRVRPGANADCGNLEGLGDRRAHWCGDTLQDDRKRTRVLPSCARETR